MDSATALNSPSSTADNCEDDNEEFYDNEDASSTDNNFDAFSLYPSSSGDGGDSSPSVMPSLQSIQRQEQMMIQQQQQQQRQQQPSFNHLPSPEELSGPIDYNTGTPAFTSSNDWPPPPANTARPVSTTDIHGNNNQQSFLSNIFTCGIIPNLRPYFDVDTCDIYLRMKATFQYCLINDGFRNEVLYAAPKLGLENSSSGNHSSAGEGEAEIPVPTAKATSSASSETTTTTTPNSSPTTQGKIGPDLYGPTWITLTLVFFVAVTSNMSLYLHHYHQQRQKQQLGTIVDEGGDAAEEEWEYDINQLLRATSILYSFSFGLPTILYLILRILGGGGGGGDTNLGLADLICLYGYSLVPYLPVTWICILPYNWVQWSVLGVATLFSGMLVLRNVVGSILVESRRGGAVLGGAGVQGKSGGLIMCLVGCHLVFFLVMKLAFYHHQTK